MKLKKVEVGDRVVQAKIKIINGNPYFAYVTLYLTIEEDTHKILDPWAGMGVTQDDMIYYSPEFVKDINDDELVFCILHEVIHKVLLHIERGYGKPNLKWNVAIDLVTNILLKNNGYKPPKGVLIPDSNDQFIIAGKKIENISIKTAEEIFDELPNIPEPPSKYRMFDSHIKGTAKKTDSNGKTSGEGYGKNLNEAELNRIEKEWLKRNHSATIKARERGINIKGMPRFIEKLSEKEINWEVLLQRYISHIVPTNYSWRNRSRKSYATGIYLPGIVKENISVIIIVDASGSITQQQFDKFRSEIISMAKIYKQNITMKIFFHDTEITNEYDIKNGNIEELINMEVRAGGGTSFSEVFKELDKRNMKIDHLIFFTDGDGGKFKNPDYPILWVLTKNGTDEYIKNKGDIIRFT